MASWLMAPDCTVMDEVGALVRPVLVATRV